jgi:DNA/RNA endonuclease G (NUC1)
MGSGRAVGFQLPNKGLPKTDVAGFVVPIASIENATGIEFLESLPERTRTEIETNAGEPWGHTESCNASSGD